MARFTEWTRNSGRRTENGGRRPRDGERRKTDDDNDVDERQAKSYERRMAHNGRRYDR